jgi:hypothetical protein
LPRVSNSKGLTTGSSPIPDRLKPVRSEADAAETVERLIPRRLLKISEGDVLITREPGGIQAESRAIYQLHVEGHGPLPDKFTSFEHAAIRGEELATERKVRVFYFEQKGDPPFLLKDSRTLPTRLEDLEADYVPYVHARIHCDPQNAENYERLPNYDVLAAEIRKLTRRGQ